MRKSDLVAGKHVVKYRCGWFRFVDECDRLLDSDGNHMQELDSYDERLNESEGGKALDIVAVYELNEVWKCEEPTMTITEDEKVILRNLPEEYKFIARDSYNVLYIYTDEPEKGDISWKVYSGSFDKLIVSDKLFRMIYWGDDEPWKIEDLLKLDVEKDE